MKLMIDSSNCSSTWLLNKLFTVINFNLQRMQERMRLLGVSFRPHVKTTKAIDIAKLQLGKQLSLNRSIPKGKAEDARRSVLRRCCVVHRPSMLWVFR